MNVFPPSVESGADQDANRLRPGADWDDGTVNWLMVGEVSATTRPRLLEKHSGAAQNDRVEVNSFRKNVMCSFGHSVREIERSHNRVVIEETPTTGGVWVFGGLTLLVVVLWLTGPRLPKSTLADESVGAFAVMFFLFFALWASVRSTFTADRLSGQLVIERRILFRTLRTAYDAHTIDRVYVRDMGKGLGLYVRFKSGRKKRLSMTLEIIWLEDFATALNDVLYSHRERKTQL